MLGFAMYGVICSTDGYPPPGSLTLSACTFTRTFTFTCIVAYLLLPIDYVYTSTELNPRGTTTT